MRSERIRTGGVPDPSVSTADPQRPRALRILSGADFPPSLADIAVAVRAGELIREATPDRVEKRLVSVSHRHPLHLEAPRR